MTQYQKWLSKRYVAYSFLTNLWFSGAVWLYFYRLFITDREIGILDGFAFAIGLIAEVPSGALADKFGRGRMVKLGYACVGFGYLLQAFGVGGFLTFFIGQSILMIGIAFISGADEALFFDKLDFKQESVDWRKLVTISSKASLIASTIAYVIGGFVFNFDPRAPFIISGFSFLSAIFLIWSIKDDRPERIKQKYWLEIKEYLLSIKLGFLQFRTKKLFLYVPLIITLQGLFYTFGWGLLRLILLDRFHFTPFEGSIAIATISLFTIIILSFMQKHADRLSEKNVLAFVSTFAGISLLLSLFDIGKFGYIVIFILYAGERLIQPFMSEILNYRTPSNQRATILSVASFLRTIPYVMLAPIIGFLNSQNKFEYFLIVWTVLIFASAIFYLVVKKSDNQITLSEF